MSPFSKHLHLLSLPLPPRFGIGPSQYVVRVGGSDRILTPERVVVHRKFRADQGPGGHDLALLRLPSPKDHCLTFDPHTNAACLPTPDAAGGKTPLSCIAVVTAGWDGPGTPHFPLPLNYNLLGYMV